MHLAGVRRLLVVTFAALVLALLGVVTWALLDGGSTNDNEGSAPSPGTRPAIGDHWHGAIAIFIDGERQPHIPTFTGPEGIHTHGDGIIHIHPFIPAGEGAGAALRKFFEYGGGALSEDSVRIPGQRELLEGEVRILRADSGIHPLGSAFREAIRVCDEMTEFENVGADYVPQDGDCIRIVFESE